MCRQIGEADNLETYRTTLLFESILQCYDQVLEHRRFDADITLQ